MRCGGEAINIRFVLRKMRQVNFSFPWADVCRSNGTLAGESIQQRSSLLDAWYKYAMAFHLHFGWCILPLHYCLQLGALKSERNFYPCDKSMALLKRVDFIILFLLLWKNLHTITYILHRYLEFLCFVHFNVILTIHFCNVIK